jgi:hypothetical protein
MGGESGALHAHLQQPTDLFQRWLLSNGSKVPTEFQAEFSSADGKHLSFTAIVERLRLSRKAEDERISKVAKAEYGTSFTEHFSYRKGWV